MLTEDNLDELDGLIAANANAFKRFIGNTIGNLPSPWTGVMLEGFKISARHWLRISFHAEEATIMARREQKLATAGRHAPLDHRLPRPAIVAPEAVGRAAALAGSTGARVHLLHISSAAELRSLAEAKARGVDITGETCPCYLVLNSGGCARLDSVIRAPPPVREAADSEAIWHALRNGAVDMIATDHAPHTPDEKTQTLFWTADCGFPCVEMQMPLMLNAVSEGRLSIEDYVRISAKRPPAPSGCGP